MSRLPSEYQEVEYLGSTGTQYIQTNVSIQNVRRAVGDVSFNTAAPMELNYVAGVRNSSKTALGFGVLGTTRGGFTCYPFEWKTNDIAYAVTANEKINFDTVINETNTTFKVNGITRYTGTTTSASSAGFTGTNTITIGALMSAPSVGVSSPQYSLLGKVFNIKMYDGSDNLIFNGIPAKNSSNVLGLYDTVSETFLTNAGTGTFIAGPDVLYGQLGSVDVAKNPGIEVVNGIIEQYKASTSDISANSFVEFVDNMWTNTDTSLTSIANSSGYAGAVLIDDNKVFIAHQSDGTNKYLNGVVCTISGTTITPGTDTTLVATSDSAYMANGSSAVLIDDNKVFIAHQSDGTNKYLNGIVCSISGTTITAGTDTTLVSVSNSATILSPVLIDTNKVFIAHSNNSSNYYLNGIVCTISGTTITPGTDTTLVSTQYAGNVASAVLIDTNKVFIAHQSNSNYYLNGIVCTISGTTITPGTDTTLRSIMYSSNAARVCFIDTNKVFITHNSGKLYPNSSPTYYLYGIVCTISGTTITPGTDTTIYTYTYSAYGASIALINTNKVFIAHQSDGTNRYLKGIVCTISGTTITHGTDTTLISTTQSAVDASAVLVYDNKVLIAHKSDSTNGYLNGIIANLKKITAATTQIDGVTVSKCTTTSAGKVYVL